MRGSGALPRALRGALAGTLLASLPTLTACGPGGAQSPDKRERAALQRVLERQSAAVHSGSEREYLATLDPRAGRYRTAQREVFRNLRRLPLTRLSYRVTEVRHTGRDGGSRTEAVARLDYRLRGDDRAPVTATERLAFVQRDGRWYVGSELPGSDRQLWEQGRLTPVRGERSLVLGVGRGREELSALAREADRAVRAVSRIWPREWPRRVVLEAPASLRAMAQLLDSPPSSYEGIAAVTTGQSERSAAAPADRIVINPEAYGLLSQEGRQVVVTHETVHVATRTHTGPATPMWLSEGLADWAGYSVTGREPADAAAELARAVETGGAPRELPSDADFRFGGDPGKLGRAYESGWLACRLIAERWGEGKLLSFYLRVGEAEKTGGAGLDRAMREELGLTVAEFTERWRSYVSREVS